MINPFKPFSRAAIFSLEKTLNAALKLDPSLKSKLIEIDGTVLGITFTVGLVDKDIYLQFIENKIKVYGDMDKNANAHIQGNPLSMIRLFTAKNKQAVLFSGNIKIFGDSSVLFKLQKIFAKMDIDWEAAITQLSGDILGHQLSRLLRKSFRWGKKASDNLVADIDEYLHEEIKTFPSRSEVDAYFNEIDSLRLDTDRLNAKFSMLKQAVDVTK